MILKNKSFGLNNDDSSTNVHQVTLYFIVHGLAINLSQKWQLIAQKFLITIRVNHHALESPNFLLLGQVGQFLLFSMCSHQVPIKFPP